MENGKTQKSSAIRKRMADDIAAVLSGVMAVTSAALPVQPGEISVTEAVLGALFVGFVAMVTRFLNDRTKKRTELGRRLRWDELGGILEVSAMALVFPALTAIAVLLGLAGGWSWSARISSIFYLGIATVFTAGFMSSYVLDARFLAAGSQGSMWAALAIMLTLVKKLA
ncbi:MAG: hypothetical protein ACLQU2_03895 [Candidatus Binataceae bacterium]